MSYAIIRNEKLTRAKCIGIYNHNERKTKNHSNKNIDNTKTYQNYYLKKNKLSYIKEFDKIKEECNLKGQIKVTSNIMCEMIFTSDQNFFDEIGFEETKRYFRESYNFICNYKNLGSKNIVSAVVHLDEDTPHMHLLYIPVIHTKDNKGNDIDKVSCREFWKGKDSYRKLQDSYHKYITSKGFNLERGQAVEITDREHLSIKEYKQITNFENTKKSLKELKVELPDTPDLKDIKKVMLNRDYKIEQEIIKPRDNLIGILACKNKVLTQELSKQVNLVSKAEDYQRENTILKKENSELSSNYEKLKSKYNIETSNMKKRINTLKENINCITKKFEQLKNTFKAFFSWVASKLSNETENTLIKQFKEEKNVEVDIINEIRPTYQTVEKEDFEMEL